MPMTFKLSKMKIDENCEWRFSLKYLLFAFTLKISDDLKENLNYVKFIKWKSTFDWVEVRGLGNYSKFVLV